MRGRSGFLFVTNTVDYQGFWCEIICVISRSAEAGPYRAFDKIHNGEPKEKV